MKNFKTTLLLLALGATTILSSCKKEDKEVDPRDAYVGRYDMEGQGDCKDEEYSLEIAKDPKSATGLIVNFELYEDYGGEDISAELKSGKIILDSYDFEVERNDGTIAELTLDAEGTMSGKTLTLEIELNGDSICDFEGDKR